MPVNKDDPARRFVQAEVEVPGNPEEVWRAIASGPGISSWFVPTTIEHDDDGNPTRAVASFGPGMDSVSTITEWDPPNRFAATSKDLGPDAPDIASEWIVEARDGGTCIVRIVHSLFTSQDDWDDQMEAWEAGWPDFFRILRLYLQHFSGQPCTGTQAQAMTPRPRAEAWSKVTERLGFAGAQPGEHRQAASSAPTLHATVEHSGKSGHPEEFLLVVDKPGPAIAHLFAMSMGEQTLVSMRVFAYGEGAEPDQVDAWNAWLAETLA